MIALRTGTVRQLQRWANDIDTSGATVDVTAAQAAERVLTLAAALNTHDRRTGVTANGCGRSRT